MPPLEVTVDQELCELIVQAVGKLEPEDRAALVGHLYKLYSYKSFEEMERKNFNRQDRQDRQDRFYDAPYPGGPFS